MLEEITIETLQFDCDWKWNIFASFNKLSQSSSLCFFFIYKKKTNWLRKTRARTTLSSCNKLIF